MSWILTARSLPRYRTNRRTFTRFLRAFLRWCDARSAKGRDKDLSSFYFNALHGSADGKFYINVMPMRGSSASFRDLFVFFSFNDFRVTACPSLFSLNILFPRLARFDNISRWMKYLYVLDYRNSEISSSIDPMLFARHRSKCTIV